MKAPLLPRLGLPLLLLATLPAFRPATPWATVATIGTAEDGREVRQVAAFTQINLATTAEVILTQGDVQKVEVAASAEDLKDLETTVEGGRLRIGTPKGKWNNWRGFKDPVKVYVTVPRIEALSVSGSGSMRADKSLRVGNIKVAISGSGRLQVPLTAENVDASVSGSGTMQLSGSATAIEAGISGSGRIDASGLQAKTGEAHISGSGNCRLAVAETLDARISGSGNVYYAGSPRITTRISGSGRVSKG